MAHIQEIGLAEHTEAYIQQEQRNQMRQQQSGMRSKRNTQKRQQFRERNRQKFGGMN